MTPLFRSLIDESVPAIPLSVVSARELEQWVASCLVANGADLLLAVLDDEEKRTWMMSTAMDLPDDHPKNPLLVAGWNKIPWVDPGDAR